MRILSLQLLILLSFCWVNPQPCLAEPLQELTIFTWADYFDPELQQRFEETYNAKITMIYFASDENRTQKLVENSAAGVDLILTSGADLGSYVKKGWLYPLDLNQIPNVKYLNSRWQTAFPEAKEYAIPFFWGTLGIVYRADLVKKPITSWRQLFQPEPELQGRIVLMEDSRELISMGLKALGYSINSTDPKQLQKVEAMLLAQKPHVKSYNSISLEEDSTIVTGETIAAMAYSGDALMVAEHHEELTYVLPEEGSNLWVDYFVLSAKAPNPELAHKFLDFINQPEVAAQMAEFVYYASPNTAAEKLLPKEFLEDPTIYPSPASLETSEFYQSLPARAQRLRNIIGAKVLR